MGAIDLNFLGYCGIYCERCDIYVAAKAGDREKQQEIADWINKHHSAECTAVEIRCSGCKGPLDEHWSLACKVRLCASERAVTTCADCGDYDDCETLEAFYRGGDYASARATLERIREVGLEQWAGEQSR
ncbi:MAG: DUF3795 domain-containing protein [Candidatus Eisenbacteria bacterium]